MRHLLILCPPLKVHLPALETDLFLPILPAAQTGQWNAGIAAKRFSPHPQLIAISPDSLGLSIEEEPVVLIQEVGNRNPIELGQVQNQAPRQASGDAALDFNVYAAADIGDLGDFSLHQAFAVSKPTEPVRDGGDFIISKVGLVHHGCFQNLVRGAQFETMDI